MNKKLITILAFMYSSQVVCQNVGIGTTNPVEKLSIGASSEFQVDSIGNIKRINNVPTNFPEFQGYKNEILNNDGNGNLSWKKLLPIGTIVQSAYINSQLDSIGFVPYGVANVVNNQNFRGYDDGLWEETILTPPTTLNTSSIGNLVSIGNSAKFAYYNDGYIYIYNALNGLWTTSLLCNIPDFGVNRKKVKLVSNGINIYCLSGESPYTSFPYQSRRSHNTMAVYNTVANTWSACANMPDSLTAIGGCSFAGNLAVLGGFKYLNSTIGYVHNTKYYTYVPSTNSWVTTSNYLNNLLLYPDQILKDPCIFKNSAGIYLAGNLNETYLNSQPIFSLQYMLFFPNAGSGNYNIRQELSPSDGISMCSVNLSDTVLTTFNCNKISKSFVAMNSNLSNGYIKSPPSNYSTYIQNIASVWYLGKYYIFSGSKIYKYTPHAGVAEPKFGVPLDTELYYYIKNN